MQSDKRDRRVQYTRMVLRDSLIELLHEQPIEQISVKALCEVADVNRSTFYNHYKDQYDMLQKIQEEVLADLDRYMSAYSVWGSEADLLRIMRRIFEYISANAPLCRVLLADKGDASLQGAIMKIARAHSETKLRNTGLADSGMLHYLLLYWVNGCTGIIHWWLQSGMDRTASEMAEMAVALTYGGMKAYTSPKVNSN